ncbi:MAG: chlorobactene glucosyltransferase [Bradymonadia bacterium]|jgi:chlorobactene glucosyltransferase
MDADTALCPGALERAGSLVHRYDLDVLTAVPRQETLTWLERLVVPFLHVIYASWLPMVLVHRSQDPKFLAANGQFLMVSSGGYDACGGFEAVRNAIVDDMAFCANAKGNGLKVLFADGHHLSRCRMYTSASEVWQGFSKNLYEGIGSHPLALIATLALLGCTFVAPVLLLALSPLLPALFVPAAVGTAALFAQRVLLAFRHKHPLSSVLLHPVAALAVMAIAVNSARWHLRGTVRWAGRTYEGGQHRRTT